VCDESRPHGVGLTKIQKSELVKNGFDIVGSLGPITSGQNAVNATGYITAQNVWTGDTVGFWYNGSGATLSANNDYGDGPSLFDSIQSQPVISSLVTASIGSTDPFNYRINLTAVVPGAAGNLVTIPVTENGGHYIVSLNEAGTENGLSGGIDATHETANFTVTHGSDATGNITVIVNSQTYNVAVSAGDSATVVATKIYNQLNTQGVTGFTVANPSNGVIEFSSQATGSTIVPLTVSVND
jgi:hypothetical protein